MVIVIIVGHIEVKERIMPHVHVATVQSQYEENEWRCAELVQNSSPPSIDRVTDVTSVPLNEYSNKTPKRISAIPSEVKQRTDKPILSVDTCLCTTCNGIFEDVFRTFLVICKDKKHRVNSVDESEDPCA